MAINKIINKFKKDIHSKDSIERSTIHTNDHISDITEEELALNEDVLAAKDVVELGDELSILKKSAELTDDEYISELRKIYGSQLPHRFKTMSDDEREDVLIKLNASQANFEQINKKLGVPQRADYVSEKAFLNTVTQKYKAYLPPQFKYMGDKERARALFNAAVRYTSSKNDKDISVDNDSPHNFPEYDPYKLIAAKYGAKLPPHFKYLEEDQKAEIVQNLEKEHTLFNQNIERPVRENFKSEDEYILAIQNRYKALLPGNFKYLSERDREKIIADIEGVPFDEASYEKDIIDPSLKYQSVEELKKKYGAFIPANFKYLNFDEKEKILRELQTKDLTSDGKTDIGCLVILFIIFLLLVSPLLIIELNF